MKTPLLAGIAMLSASAAFAQNSVTINQSGSQSGNQAMVSQSGSGNSIVINQNSSITNADSTTESRKQPNPAPAGEGNQVSLRVDKDTQTTVNQRNSGPNSVELWQAGNSSTTINQSSDTHENTVVTHPHPVAPSEKFRPAKRRNRP